MVHRWLRERWTGPERWGALQSGQDARLLLWPERRRWDALLRAGLQAIPVAPLPRVNSQGTLVAQQ
jgi:hypothetical protein